MFQAFDAPPSINETPTRVGRLRELLARLKIDAALVPRADEHQSEYVPPSAERLKWLTGFSGSAGSAVVTRESAALFVDGRYTVQSRQQVDTGLFEILQTPQNTPADWLVKTLTAGAVIGFDPWLHTVSDIERLETKLSRHGVKLKALSRNPIDRIWGSGRPKPPAGKVRPQAEIYAGRPAHEKIAGIQAGLAEDGQDAVVLTLSDSIAWAFNIRGSDVAHNPVALAFAIVPAEGEPELFIAPEKVDEEARAHLAAIARISDPSQLADRIAALKEAGKRVRLDPDTAAWAIARKLGGAQKIKRGADPCILPKARKNPVEIEGARTAQLRDGAAVTRFLAWIDREAPSGNLDEITAAKRLEEMLTA